MKMHFDRMAPVVERIARERRGLDAYQTGSSSLLPSSINVGSGAEFGLNPGNPFANALGFDIAKTGVPNVQADIFSDGLETFMFPERTLDAPASILGDVAALHWDGQGFPTQPLLLEKLPYLPNLANSVHHTIPMEEQSKKSSPLLCQLFNNEIFSQATTTPQVLTEKVQTMTFSDTNKNATDGEKLLSTINSEPYLLDVLDLSIKWWIAWREQAFALQDVFAFPEKGRMQDDLLSGSSSGSCTDTSSTSSSRPSPSSGTRTYSGDQPISLRDFVNLKLSDTNDPVSLSTGLFCIALSLSQLRTGVDDSLLNISTTPAEVAERITLAVDTVVLSPSSNPAYMRDPSVLLLLMMRAKMYAESNQLRKSWLTIRQAIEVAKKIGFTESKIPIDAGDFAEKTCPGELRMLFHRQRFVGSIMELDRLMSMVLGFPHAEDVKFTDRLAMAVLKGQAPPGVNGNSSQVSSDIKMRALRRVVSIVAGRVNDRNACSDPDETKHQTTQEIQKTLDEAAAAMPAGWWDVDSHIHYADPYVAHEHLVAQMWFWQVQAFLHLPFMLKPCTNLHNPHKQVDASSDEYFMNRYMCLQGCRGMIRVFTLLRSDPSLAVYICSCEDFQGVFSACILMVGVLIRLAFCPQVGPAADVMGNVDDDLLLIKEIKDVFQYRSLQQSGGISKQGLKVLEELGSFLDEGTEFDTDQPRRRTVVLPYFGAIHLELRPPREWRTKSTDIETQTLGALLDPTPPSSTDQSVEGGTAPEYSDATSLMLPDWTVDDTSQLVVSDGNLNWDQFLFGTELGQDWEADPPQWPADDSLWEWS